MRYEDQLLPLERAGPELFVMPEKVVKGLSQPSHCNERTSREDKDKTSTRARSAPEEELLDELARILGPKEMLKNGGLWRQRIRHYPRAVAYAIEDYKVRTPDQKRTIKNLPAWLTDRYARALVEIGGYKADATNSE